MLQNFKVALGTQAKDVITGFVGRVTGRVQYITGCNRYLVQPTVKKDGKVPEAEWIDEDRLDVFGKVLSLAGRNAGPDKPAPKK